MPLFGDDYVFLDFARTRSLLEAFSQPDPIGPFYRPLSEVGYFWFLGHASEAAFTFHVANLALVLAIGGMIYWITAKLGSFRAALFASAVWSLHYAWEPTVQWASGSQDLLATLASLIAIRIAQEGRMGWAAIATLFALLSKETSVAAIPVVVLLSRRPDERWRHSVRRAWPLGLAILVWFALWFPRFTTALQQTSSYFSPHANGLFFALIHLVQVLVGAEWGRGVGVHFGVATFVAVGLATLAVVLGRGRPPHGDRLWAKTPGAYPALAIWILAGAAPIASVVQFWSAYQYMFSISGWACLVGLSASRLRAWPSAVLIALLGLGSGLGRGLQGNANQATPTNTISHVNSYHLRRGEELVARYLGQMRKEYPRLASNTTLFFAGVPASVGWQSGDGALIRWAYADTSLRSYRLSQYSRDLAGRGPVLFLRADDQGIHPLRGGSLLRQIGIALLADDRTAGAADALARMLADSPHDATALYYSAWVAWSRGDSTQAMAMLDRAGLTARPGPLPDLATVRAYEEQGDFLRAIALLTPWLEGHELDAEGHALFARLLARFPDGQDAALVETFAARVLEPRNSQYWAQWGKLQIRAHREVQGMASLREAIRLSPGQRDPELEAILAKPPQSSPISD